jgi:hypothetical protein
VLIEYGVGRFRILHSGVEACPGFAIGEDALAMPSAPIRDRNGTLIVCRLLDELGSVP